MSSRLPNLVYVGMGKAGSSLVYRTIGRHPDIQLSHKKKEINFFQQDKNWLKGLEWYASHFPVYSRARYVGDVSPGYHTKPKALRRIHESLGQDVRILFSLRRYTDFVYSRYLQIIRSRFPEKNIFELLEHRKAIYRDIHAVVANLYELFGDKVLVLIYEQDFDRRNPTFERKIYEFLGVDASTQYYSRANDQQINSGKVPHFLYDYDRDIEWVHNENLYVVPRNVLVFCSGPNQCRIWRSPSKETVAWARNLEKKWTISIGEEEWVRLHELYTVPLARKLENSFGFALHHWYEVPERKEYERAPPPRQFLAAKKMLMRDRSGFT